MEKLKHITTKRQYIDNRLELKDSMLLYFAYDKDDNTDYWYDYVSEVIKIEKGIDSKKNISERLKKLNSLRSKNIVAHVDIKRKSNQMFEPSVDYSKYNFLIMHFVVDSITDTKNSYFELLDTVIKKIIKKGDLFLMSALVECTTWDDGEKSYPSANISTKEIIERLKLLGAEIITHSEKIHKAGVGHNGGFAVILASF